LASHCPRHFLLRSQRPVSIVPRYSRAGANMSMAAGVGVFARQSLLQRHVSPGHSNGCRWQQWNSGRRTNIAVCSSCGKHNLRIVQTIVSPCQALELGRSMVVTASRVQCACPRGSRPIRSCCMALVATGHPTGAFAVAALRCRPRIASGGPSGGFPWRRQSTVCKIRRATSTSFQKMHRVHAQTAVGRSVAGPMSPFTQGTA